jgi:cytochrome P450
MSYDKVPTQYVGRGLAISLIGFSEIRRAQSASRNVRGITENILQKYRNNTQTATSSKGTVVEYIVNNKNYLNDKERIADMVIFLVAGHDTTAFAIAWTLLELARNPTWSKIFVTKWLI